MVDGPKKVTSVRPSLVRMTELNNDYILNEVIPSVCQVREFDHAKLAFVRGKTGWIVFGPVKFQPLPPKRASKRLPPRIMRTKH